MLDADTESFKSILGLDPFSQFLVLIFVFFCFFYEFLNFFFGKTTFIVGDSNLGILVAYFVSGLDIHDSVLVDFESDLDLRNSTWSRSNTR